MRIRAILCFSVLFSNHVLASDEAIPHWDVDALNAARERAGWTFDVAHNWVTDHLRNGGSINEVTGLEQPRDWRDGATFVDVVPASDLPATFDWRDQVPGGLQPVRNQANCGSCWAFSVTAVLESLVRIARPGTEVDLAEQTLVSSCSSSGSCSGGYFSAFNYLRNPGLPNESDDPYQARNSRCKSGLAPQEKVVSWAYVGNGGASPTIAQIKTAIQTYGPVSVDVNASFSGYESGIYNRCNTSGTNHMVNLEGWVDDEEGGYWIMRNSWGANWGEDGYMRIRYTDSRGRKCNNIGRVAAFAQLPAPGL